MARAAKLDNAAFFCVDGVAALFLGMKSLLDSGAGAVTMRDQGVERSALSFYTQNSLLKSA